MIHNSNIIVTGGAGFIGSHLVEQLIAYNARVTVIDNLSTGSLDNIDHCMNSIHFIKEDIRNQAAMADALKNTDIIFHLAAQTSVSESQENPAACFDTNVVGTLSLLQAAQSNQCKRFIFASSAAVYGNQSPCSEKTPCKPISHYGSSKLVGEQLCTHFFTAYGLATTSLRFFNVYGKRQNTKTSHPSITAHIRASMEQNKPITIYGDGTQQRDFVPVEYIVQTLLAVANAPAHSVQGQSFNVATGNSISVLKLIETIRDEFPSYNVPLHFLPARSGDIYESKAICSKLKTIASYSLAWHSSGVVPSK